MPKSIELTSDLVIKQLNESHTKELFSLTDSNRSYLKRWLPWLDSCTRESDTLKIKMGKLATTDEMNYMEVYKKFRETHFMFYTTIPPRNKPNS